MKIGVIGCEGYVGRAMVKFFMKKYECAGVDINWDQKFIDNAWDNINETCDVGVVCVPTPEYENGSCNTSIVEDVVKRLETPLILVKSTVSPGTIDRLKEKTGKRIAFSPEYTGEPDYDPGHDFQDTVANEPFYIFGGDKEDTTALVNIFSRIAGPTKKYMQCTAKEAEVIKYMENTTFGVKVVMAYEFHQICEALEVDWNTVREGWLLDPRINPSHTAVFPDNKEPYSGKCLPKDINAFRAAARKAGYKPNFLDEVAKSNKRIGKDRARQRKILETEE